MPVAARKRSKVEVLRNVLNPLLVEHGASIGEDGDLQLEEHHSLAAVLALLMRLNREHTVVMNFALGKCWACMGGRRLEILRGIVGASACDGVSRRLMNYASVYRRWVVPQGNHNWTWHREHMQNKMGMVTQCVPPVKAVKIAGELGIEFLHKANYEMPNGMTSDACFAFVRWKDAVLALEHMTDDADEFEEE